GAGGPSSATDALPGAQLSAYALTGRGPGRQALALVVAADPHDPPAHTIAGVAAVLLSLITGPAGDRGPAATGHAAALVRLLVGARPAEVAPLLGAPLWTVVHAERRRETTGSAASLATALGTPLLAPALTAGGTGPDTGAGTGAGTDTGAGAAGTEGTGAGTTARAAESEGTRAGATAGTEATPAGVTLRALVPGDREITAQPGWTLGVSAPVPVEELPAADRHAATALRRALAQHAPLIRQRAPGPHGIASLVTADDARQHARALLAPLAGSPPLLDTLHNWLSLHGNWDRTATSLGIHRNTVRQRISRITTLLDTDLDDADVRMELWFALRTLDRDAATHR
ncbi:helix-turn-helix domain-containing protein, partial [Streptomyces lydicus]